jgi:glyoxylase-like metal-dependent hydrolase (beta-lactamase superfamily II)
MTGIYTGKVVVGGPADTRELGALRITKIAVGPMSNNAYLLRCAATGDGLLIDAAAEAHALGELLTSQSIEQLVQVVTTHRHADHWQALGEIVASTGAVTAAGRADAAELPVHTDVLLDNGDELWIGDQQLRIMGLRGHTPGSIAVLHTDSEGLSHLFSGDSLFPGGVGKTGSHADFVSLLDDVEERIFNRLPDSTWVYPGHGNDTTVGAERPQLTEWRARGW